MYRAHIQHGTQQPVVVTHTTWREDEQQARREVEIITIGSASPKPDPGWEYLRFSGNGLNHGLITIEQREDA